MKKISILNEESVPKKKHKSNQYNNNEWADHTNVVQIEISSICVVKL